MHDRGDRARVEFAILRPLGQMQHDIGVFAGLLDIGCVVQGRELGAGVVDRDRIVDPDPRALQLDRRRDVERG
ncbi:hypothetical protein PA7_00600 [Pseudonocardia asaccharolytica DSM 44247 = NBRC 16224]|uniref:Uncharacterized protein n=1 Tax=Pseudonocardia asaccharolytica DSM 44247 = NBRC 16224 TaxID=1123024 RepID=A0A511CVE8_9PSEU|nr:hypothetical protein PA7_00600 [Pseudonocardia asaccharolytica DSM 44247 = NBRC 16224]